jgi:hypothetical protein
VSGFSLYLYRVTQNYGSFLTLFANTVKDAAAIPKPGILLPSNIFLQNSMNFISTCLCSNDIKIVRPTKE